METSDDTPDVPLHMHSVLALDLAWMLNDVAVALVRAHPEPERLQRELVRVFNESAESRIPFTDLTSELQPVRRAVDGCRSALLRVASACASTGKPASE